MPLTTPYPPKSLKHLSLKQMRYIVYLHRLIDVSTVQHQVVILKIVKSRLPGHVLCLLRQIGGCPQSQSGGDQLSPAQWSTHILYELPQR